MRYIGKTDHSLEARLKGHLKSGDLKKNNHKSHWIRALLGRAAYPVIHSIQTLYTAEDLDTAEIYWIKFFRDQGCRLTNGTDGGEGGRPSADARAKISAYNRKRVFTVEHRANMSKAASHPTLETRAKMSAAQRGRKTSQVTRDKQSAANKGRHLSEKIKTKMSASATASWADPLIKRTVGPRDASGRWHPKVKSDAS